jgi:4'-phosphopantetheinyl transferase EntD
VSAIGGILPRSVAVATRREDVPESDLFPEEREAMGKAVEKRRREFATGRACARDALAQLGIPPRALPPGEGGAPQWPRGTVGSITHCEGYRACAAARKTDVLTLGIDAEPNQPLPGEVLPDIALPAEVEWLERALRSDPSIRWDRLLFCAKEAIYKAWYPLARRWLGFEDATVKIAREQRTFTAELLVAGPSVGGRELTGFTGRWVVEDGLILAAIAMPPASEAGV